MTTDKLSKLLLGKKESMQELMLIWSTINIEKT